MTAVVPMEAMEPWMERYAEWLVSCGEIPDQEQRCRRLGRFRGRSTTGRDLRKVEEAPCFVAYLQQITEDVSREARAVLSEAAREAAEAHVEAIRALRKEKDYKTMHKYTQPVLDRVWPRLEQAGASRVQVTIQVSGGFASRMLVEEIPEAEVEVL